MSAQNKRAQGAAGRQDSQHCLRILDGICSWQFWSSAVLILLLPATLILLSFASRLRETILFQDIDPVWMAGTSLGALWLMTAFTLYRQRGQFGLLRKDLIEQSDAATRTRVRGEQFYGQSILDPLTGMYNRRFGETRLTEEIARAQESKDPLLLVAFDFDRFKQINDQLGHAAGDLALKEFSRRLQRAIRACDVPIRVGGDEFLLILPDCPPENAKLIFSRMGEITFNLNGKQIPLFFSHGIAQYQVNDTLEAMIRRADERLYEAKAERKAREQTVQAAGPNTLVTTKATECTFSSQSVSESVKVGISGRTRRSIRILKQIPVVLIGHDLLGKVFTEHTKTVNISQHGMGVVSKLKIAPDQEMIVRREDTNQEAPVRVVRAIRSTSRTQTYGLEFAGSDDNIWNPEFQPLTESELRSEMSVFECSRCKRRTPLDNKDLELNKNSGNMDIIRPCDRCGCETNWMRVSGDPTSMGDTKEPEAADLKVTVN